jgi:uncharacterized protein (DUF1330 family)
VTDYVTVDIAITNPVCYEEHKRLVPSAMAAYGGEE